jgi:antitoxin YefM
MGVPTIDLTEDIKPISEFRANAAALVRQVQDTGRPVVITQHGQSAAVLMDVAEYQRLTDEVETLREIAAARRDFDAQRTESHQDVMARARARLG